MKTLLITIMAMFFITSTANGQFLKKLKKKAKEAVEQTVINKTAQKAAEVAADGVDRVFDIKFTAGENGELPIVNPAELPAVYSFDWKYSLKMEHEKGDMVFHYYLSETEPYFGSQPEMQGNPMANNFMIFDVVNDVMVILTSHQTGNTGAALSTDLNNMSTEEVELDDEVYEDYSYEKIGTKEILGYQCQGYRIENDDYIITSYVAVDTPVSFINMGQGMPKTLPKGFNPGLLKDSQNSLMMEMQMEHKNKQNYNATMKAVALEQVDADFQMADYDFSFQQQQQ